MDKPSAVRLLFPIGELQIRAAGCRFHVRNRYSGFGLPDSVDNRIVTSMTSAYTAGPSESRRTDRILRHARHVRRVLEKGRGSRGLEQTGSTIL